MTATESRCRSCGASLSEHDRQLRGDLWSRLCRHLDRYPTTSPYNALRQAFAKQAKQGIRETP